jgi:hypothetical protein
MVSLVAAVIVFLGPNPSPPNGIAWMAAELLSVLALYGLFRTLAIGGDADPQTADASGLIGGGPVRGVILVAVAAAFALDALVLMRYPELRGMGEAGTAGYVAAGVVTVVFIGILAAYVWLAVTRTRSRSPGAVVARRYGLVAGCVSGGLLLGASYVPFPTALMVAAAGTIAAVAGLLAARAGGDPRAGVQAGVWSGVVAGLVLFVGSGGLLLFMGGPSQGPNMIATFHASKFHDFRSWSLAGTFGLDGDPPLVGLLLSLVFVPLFATGLAAFGATRKNRLNPVIGAPPPVGGP